MKLCTRDLGGANQNRLAEPLSSRRNSSEMSPMTELARLLAVSAFPEWHLQIERGNEPTNSLDSEIFLIRGEFLLWNGGGERERGDWRVRSSNRWRGGGGDAMTKMMSSFWGSVRWQKVVTQLSNPFAPLSLSLSLSLSLLPPMPLPLSGHPSEASDNDNVAFGIPTDLETTSRSSEARKAGEREERRNGVFVVFVVRVVGDKHYYRGFRGGSLKCSLAEMGEDHDLRS